jgi:hypothetical protein
VALAYNKFLGFKEKGPALNKEFLLISLLRNDYQTTAEKIKEHLPDSKEKIILKNTISTFESLRNNNVDITATHEMFTISN